MLARSVHTYKDIIQFSAYVFIASLYVFIHRLVKWHSGSERVHHEISNTLEWIIHPHTEFQQSITKTKRPNQGAVMFFSP